MKKIMKKPVLAVVAAVGIIGGLTPILANASSFGSPAATKVVMNDEGKQVTRYNLKELAKNDPTTLNMLLKTQADHLYIVVDPINLDVKLQTYMDEHKEEWESVYQKYYSDIWLEVRFTDHAVDSIVSVNAQTEDDKVYIKGIVSDDVTKVVVTKPNKDTIEVVPTSEHSFTVIFAADAASTNPYAIVRAYAGDKLVGEEKVKIVAKAEEQADLLLNSYAILDAKKGELEVKGIVKLDAGKVYVTYNGVKKEADVKKLWDGVGSFSVKMKDVKTGMGKAVVEIYEDGQKKDSESVEVKVVNTPATGETQTFTIQGTAVLNAKDKSVEVKGTVLGWDKKTKAKLVVVAPDGKKQEVKPNDKGEFTVKLSFKNRSYDAKAIHFEVYVDGKLVSQANIPHGTPVNQQPVKPVEKKDHDQKDEKKGKDKHKDKHPNGNAYGYWKKHGHDQDQDDQGEDNDD